MSKELEALNRLEEHCLSNVGASYKESIDSRTLIKEDLELLKRQAKAVEALRNGISLHSFAFYDEHAERDRMCYQIIFKNGYRESISQDLYLLLEETLIWKEM